MARLVIEGDKKYLDIINKRSRVIISKNGLSSKIDEGKTNNASKAKVVKPNGDKKGNTPKDNKNKK